MRHANAVENDRSAIGEHTGALRIPGKNAKGKRKTAKNNQNQSLAGS